MAMNKFGRNDSCPCGSGRKYKHCCILRDQARKTSKQTKVARQSFQVPETIQAAIRHHQEGRLAEAKAIYQQVLAVNPSNFDALHLLGVIARQVGDTQQAINLISQAVQQNPSNPFAHFNLGNAFKDQGNLDESIACYHQALSLKPDYADALVNLGIVFDRLDKLDQAASCFQKALTLNPDHIEAHNNLGLVFKRLGELDKALSCFKLALSLRPDYAEAYVNLGGICREQGKLSESMAYHLKAASLNPNFANAHYGIGTLFLQMGNLCNGWVKFEYRWYRETDPTPQRTFPQPWWQGEDLQGKTILVWGEQGLGDELRYASFIPELSRLAKHCVFECEPRLTSLFSRSFPTAEVIPKSNPPHPRTTGTDIAVQSPAASLAHWLRPHLESFPQHNGYLVADPERIAYWQMRINALGTGLKVGISWRSGIMTSERAKPHTPLDQWGLILSIPGVTFINLQYGKCLEELEQVERQFGIRIHRWNDIDLKNNLDETAALTMALDLVISTGTAVTDMAAALGRPSWMLHLRYFSWDDLGQNYMPWYPGMRLFYRDWNEDWTRVIDTVAQELGKAVALPRNASTIA